PPQTVNGWIFHAARAPNETQFENIMEINLKPFKPAAYNALMAFDRKRSAHHAGPADTVIGDQTTSNPVEQNMSMIGAEARKLTPYGLAIAILEKTAQKMAERAELRIGRADRLTPFAAQQYKYALHILLPSLSATNKHIIQQTRTEQQQRRVTASFAAVRCWLGLHDELDKQDELLALVDSAYHLATYRAVYADERFEVQLSVSEELVVDTTMLPPYQVEGRAGRPARGPAQSKRFRGRGGKNALSSFNVRVTP
ncbi:unnamed protein product, partial [Pylaiella littoralis]